MTQEQNPGTETTTTRSGSNIRLYAMAAIGCFLFASLLYIVSKPVEKTGPPRDPRTTAAGAPGERGEHEGHNHEGEGLDEELRLLRERIAGGQASSEEILTLANILYDQGARARTSGIQGADEAAVRFFGESSFLYAEYLQKVPGDNDARTDFAYTLYQTGRLDQAIKELRTVREDDSGHQNSAFNLAMMYVQKDRPDSVLHYLQLTASIDSSTNSGRNALEALRTYTEAH